MSADLISMYSPHIISLFLKGKEEGQGNVVNVIETLYLHPLSSQTNSLLKMLQRDVLGG